MQAALFHSDQLHAATSVRLDGTMNHSYTLPTRRDDAAHAHALTRGMQWSWLGHAASGLRQRLLGKAQAHLVDSAWHKTADALLRAKHVREGV